MLRPLALAALCSCCIACSSDETPPASTVEDTATDSGTADSGASDSGAGDTGLADSDSPDITAGDAADGGDGDTMTEPEPMLPEFFPTGLPSTTLVAETPPLRTIIHAHTIFSHDACDGEPVMEDGTPNEACLASFRAALCADHIDVVMLTEHYDRMAETFDFDALFLHREGDEWVEEDGQRVANAVICDDGHRALIMPGLEGSDGAVSPIGMTGHPADGDAEAIKAAYGDSSDEGIQNLRDHGAVPVVVHIEGADQEQLATMDIDAVEVGNLHVLIAPNYREQLGLDPGLPVVAFTDWLFNPDDFPAPDLVFLEFHEQLDSYHWWWDALLQKKMVAGFAGNDVHQNVLPIEMGDGDRPDSYRRMMKWYVNYVHAEKTPSAIKNAIAKGNLTMVFEILGSPVGFDPHITDGETTWYPGDEVPSSATGLRLVAAPPAALIGDATVPVDCTLRVFRITADGSEMIHEATDAIDLSLPGPGRYRVELFGSASHLATYLEGHDRLIRQFPWAYSNPITVAAP